MTMKSNKFTINNDPSKIKTNSRTARRTSTDIFKKELLQFLRKHNPHKRFDIVTFMNSPDPINGRTDFSSVLGCFITAIEKDPVVSKDLSEIKFGFDIGTAHKTPDSDLPTEFMGLHTTKTGLPFIGAGFCGDEEYAEVFFIIYFDGTQMRAYIPYYTNTYNPITKAAFCLDNETEDNAFLATIGKTTDDLENLAFDASKLLFDIEQAITII